MSYWDNDPDELEDFEDEDNYIGVSGRVRPVRDIGPLEAHHLHGGRSKYELEKDLQYLRARRTALKSRLADAELEYELHHDPSAPKYGMSSWLNKLRKISQKKTAAKQAVQSADDLIQQYWLRKTESDMLKRGTAQYSQHYKRAGAQYKSVKYFRPY